MHNNFLQIREEFRRLRSERRRHVDIAAELKISEGELIAIHVRSGQPQQLHELCGLRLRPCWPELIAALAAFGELMALTRNASCVHELKGSYLHFHQGLQRSNEAPASPPAGSSADTAAQPPSMLPPMPLIGVVSGDRISQRLFLSEWAYGFAVSELTPGGMQRSLQFYDAGGCAIHKIFLQNEAQVPIWFDFISRYAEASQTVGIKPVVLLDDDPAGPAPLSHSNGSDNAASDGSGRIDQQQFCADWGSLRDVHHFSGLLSKYRVKRLQALQLAQRKFAEQVDIRNVYQLLVASAREQIDLSILAGNRGMLQIYTGTIQRVEVMGPWLNILDPGFNLHLREDHIASTWVVRKPSVEGLVTSVELFDQRGEVIAMFFSAHQNGKQKCCEWRNLVETLMLDGQSCLL